MIRFLVPALALTIAACSAGSPASPLFGDTVTNEYIAPNYEPISVSVAAGGGGQSVILGTTRDGASAEEIAVAIRFPAFVSPRTITASAEALTGPHLVLVFAPQGPVTPLKACSGQAKGGQAGAVLTVFAAFCSSFGTPVSEGMFTAADSPVPSDPDFGRRMSVLMNAVMPVTNPDFQNGCFAGNC